MDRRDFLDAFQLKQEAAVQQKVEPQRFIKDRALIFDPYQLLILKPDVSQVQLPHHALLIDAFDQPCAQSSVHFDCDTDRLVTQPIRFLKRVDAFVSFVSFVPFCALPRVNFFPKYRLTLLASDISSNPDTSI
jgi:hypothetical protein